jgi:hypothetical protein
MILFNYIIYFCGAKEIKKQANYKTAKTQSLINGIEIFLN